MQLFFTYLNITTIYSQVIWAIIRKTAKQRPICVTSYFIFNTKTHIFYAVFSSLICESVFDDDESSLIAEILLFVWFNFIDSSLSLILEFKCVITLLMIWINYIRCCELKRTRNDFVSTRRKTMFEWFENVFVYPRMRNCQSAADLCCTHVHRQFVDKKISKFDCR